MRGKELPVSKSVLGQLSSWLSRLKSRSSDQLSFNCSPFAVRACLEALYSSFGKIKNPEQSALALYEQIHFRKIPQDGNPYSPKLMFSVFNGEKANGSKVKFAMFGGVQSQRTFSRNTFMPQQLSITPQTSHRCYLSKATKLNVWCTLSATTTQKC